MTGRIIVSTQRTTKTFGLLIAVVAALALALTALMPSSASANDDVTVTERGKVVNSDGKAPRAYYGAISLNLKDGKIGLANDKRTKRRALNAAVANCKKKSAHDGACKRTAWVKNGCGALALKKKADGSWRQGYGVAFNLAPAKRKALREAGKGAKVVAWVCTTRYA
jgi:Domain of unknown function (DUF4189)